MVNLGSGNQREINDIILTRYACYLIAQNGDPRKQEIAFAQTYFALQSRKAELIEQRLLENERVSARRKLSDNEKELSQVIYERLGSKIADLTHKSYIPHKNCDFKGMTKIIFFK